MDFSGGLRGILKTRIASFTLSVAEGLRMSFLI
jgi:hypothetical protein